MSIILPEQAFGTIPVRMQVYVSITLVTTHCECVHSFYLFPFPKEFLPTFTLCMCPSMFVITAAMSDPQCTVLWLPHASCLPCALWLWERAGQTAVCGAGDHSSRTLHRLGKCSTIELYPQPLKLSFVIVKFYSNISGNYEVKKSVILLSLGNHFIVIILSIMFSILKKNVSFHLCNE